MGYTYYRLLALIPQNVEISFDDIFERLKQRFNLVKGAVVERPTLNHIQIRFDDWLFNIHFEDEFHVLIESGEVAASVSRKRPDWEVIASSDRRVTTHAMPDPDMVYFNTFVFVMEALEAIPNLYIFDPNDGKLWKSGETPPAGS